MALVKHTNNSLSNITALPSAVPTGKMTLLSTATASNSASLSFNSTYINSDYLIYKFEFINIHPNASASFTFNVSIDNGSNYNVTKTSTYFRAFHAENGSGAALAYDTPVDLTQSTAYQDLTADSLGTDSDMGVSGCLYLFNPSSTVFVKNFITNISSNKSNNEVKNSFAAGYANTTSAVNAIDFKMDSDTIGSGQIKLYGIKGS